MRKTNPWMLAAILTLCGLTTALSSCSDSKDEAQATPIGAELYKLWYAESLSPGPSPVERRSPTPGPSPVGRGE